MAALPTIIEIRKMSTEDILSEVASIRRQATEVRMGVELSKEKDTSKMKNLRRHMARLLTVLQEKSSLVSSDSSAKKKPRKTLSTKKGTTTLPARA